MPYTNLDEDVSRPSSLRARGVRDTSPIIAKISGSNIDNARPECSSSSGSSTSCNSSEPTPYRSEVAYNNPAFEGNWERDRGHEFLDNMGNAKV
jgi:hypothetical protein